MGAGVAHEVTLECEKGHKSIEDLCGCSVPKISNNKDGVYCLHNIDHGVEVTAQFFQYLQAKGDKKQKKEGKLNANEIKTRSLMNKHNYRVGAVVSEDCFE